MPGDNPEDWDEHELKEQIVARRKVVRTMMSEIQVLTEQLRKTLGPIGMIQFLGAETEREDF